MAVLGFVISWKFQIETGLTTSVLCSRLDKHFNESFALSQKGCKRISGVREPTRRLACKTGLCAQTQKPSGNIQKQTPKPAQGQGRSHSISITAVMQKEQKSITVSTSDQRIPDHSKLLPLRFHQTIKT